MYPGSPKINGSRFKAGMILKIMAVGLMISAQWGCTKTIDPRKVPATKFVGGSDFTTDINFDAGADANYSFDSNKIALTAGNALIKGDQTDDDGSSNGFGGGSASGVAWSAVSNSVKLGSATGCDGTTTNCSELAAEWTPKYANIVQYWKLNGSGAISHGANIAATIGTAGNAYNLNGLVMTYSPAKLNGGVTFGSDDEIHIDGAAASLSTLSQGTLMMWFKADPVTASYYMFNVSNGSVASDYTSLSIGDCTGAYSDESFCFFNVRGGSVQLGMLVRDGSTKYFDGNWHHIAVATGHGNNSIYIDGQSMPITYWTGNSTTAEFMKVNGADSVRMSGLKLNNSECVSVNHFFGTLDEVAVFNAGLSTAEVGAIYQRQAPKFGGSFTSRIMDTGNSASSWTDINWKPTLPLLKSLPDYSGGVQNENSTNYSALTTNSLMNGIVGLWHLGEATGVSGAGSIKDGSGQNNHGTPNGGVTFGQKTKLGDGVLMDGSTGYITVADASSLRLTNGMTIAAWIKPKSFAQNQQILSKFWYTTFDYAYELSIDTSGKLRLDLSSTGTTYSFVLSTNPIPLNTWTHVAATFDGSTAKLFINGVQDANTLSYAGPLYASAAPLEIGRGSGGGPQYVNGWLDEVALWNRAITSTEMQQVYGRGASRLQFQVRSCNTSDCVGSTWKGPDGSANTYFSELFNMTNQATVPSGTVKTSLPNMLFTYFTSPPATNRYFQYRFIMDSDSSTTAIQPELKTVAVGPSHLDASQPTIYQQVPLKFVKLSAFTETLGSGGCPGGVTYSFSFDKTNWLYFDGADWLPTDGSWAFTNTADEASVGFTHLEALTQTDLYVRAHLNSDGSQPCELDKITISGKK